ncbi:uncharacterized protein LOC661554 [Tribolium castaneum]
MKSKRKIFLYMTVVFMFVFYVLMSLQMPNTEGEPNSGHNIVIVEGWDFNTTRDTTHYVLNTNLSAHIWPEHFCDLNSFLLVMVCSGPANFEARSAIRDTWGHERIILGNNVSLFFLLGETTNSSLQYDIMLESDRFGDIIQERFIDSYNNLTLKSVFMLKLVSSYCANSTKYLLKIDDDMFVNMIPVVRMLRDRNSTTDLLMGKLICRARPIKDTTSKWYSPRYMYPHHVYPNYVSGTGYVMSVDVAEKLYKAALKTPIFHLEDVYTTGLCAKRAGVRPKNNPLFTYQSMNYDVCLYMRLYTAHRFTPSDIRKTYTLLKDSNVTRECTYHRGRSNLSVNWLMNNILKVNKPNKNKCEKRILLLVVALIFIASLCVNSKQPPLPVPTEVEGWARNVSRNVRDYISEAAQAHIMPKNFCEEKGLLLVFIHSKFDKFDARRAIRETWGQKRDNVTFYFLLGEDKNRHHEVQLKLRDESQRFNDIVQERFVDSYNNLTLKSITMLKLFHLHCSDSYKYLLKIDDDVYLNIASALKELTNRSITTNVLLGHVYNATNAIRNPASKWFVPYELYPDEKYPPYLCGAAYIMSADVAVKLYHVALETPIFYIEDVYITGMCAKKANVTLENSGGFNCYYAKKYVCLYKQYFVYHYFEPRDIKKAHELVAGKKCPLTGSWQEWFYSLLY